MSRSSTLILLGVLVILAPLSGLPQSWISGILAILGIIVVVLGVALRAEQARRMQAATPVAPAPAPAPMIESEVAGEATPAPAAEHHAHTHHGPSAIA